MAGKGILNEAFGSRKSCQTESPFETQGVLLRCPSSCMPVPPVRWLQPHGRARAAAVQGTAISQ